MYKSQYAIVEFSPIVAQFGQTALFFASWNGHVQVVQLLLQQHANIGICDDVSSSLTVLCHCMFLLYVLVNHLNWQSKMVILKKVLLCAYCYT